MNTRCFRAQGLSIVAVSCLLFFNSSAHGGTTLKILSPLPNERFVANETIDLRVSSDDRHMDASQAVWTSSTSGVLGHGPNLQIIKLPAGTHNITVSIGSETQSVPIRIFKDLWDLYQAPPAQAEIDRLRKDFSISWVDGSSPDEKWSSYDPPTFNQALLAPSKVVVLANLDVLRHQTFSEPLPFGDWLKVYDHLRKYVKMFSLQLDCSDSAGGGGKIFLSRWQNTWPLARRDCKSLVPGARRDGYVGALALLMHEARHSEPGSPVHATCFGYGNMEGSLDKGGGHAWAILYAMWVYKYGVYDPPVMKQEARTFAYATLSRFCSKPTSSNPKVQAMIDELLGEKQANSAVIASPLPAPALLSPEKGAVLNNPAKLTTLSWAPVQSAAAYVVEWDYAWSEKDGIVWWSEQPERSRQPDQTRGWWFAARHSSLSQFSTTETSYALSFIGAQPGRWRVWAVDAADNPGNKSEWREFRYTQ
jgi:hypothetical protein